MALINTWTGDWGLSSPVCSASLTTMAVAAKRIRVCLPYNNPWRWLIIRPHMCVDKYINLRIAVLMFVYGSNNPHFPLKGSQSLPSQALPLSDVTPLGVLTTALDRHKYPTYPSRVRCASIQCPLCLSMSMDDEWQSQSQGGTRMDRP